MARYCPPSLVPVLRWHMLLQYQASTGGTEKAYAATVPGGTKVASATVSTRPVQVVLSLPLRWRMLLQHWQHQAIRDQAVLLYCYSWSSTRPVHWHWQVVQSRCQGGWAVVCCDSA
eukprot:2337387-Rhodomonas_salina.1